MMASRLCARVGATLFLLLSACGFGRSDDAVPIAYIGSAGDIEQSGLRLSPAGQQVRAATAQGLVALDQNGDIVPGLAERWIVTDDAMSYIFRLRNTTWSDGTRVTGENVRAALQKNLAGLAGTSLGLDLGIIDEIRAMTGRVIEIRLKSPMPQFLQLVAQPELGLERNGDGSGPMTTTLTNEGLIVKVLPPDKRGLPDSEDWEDTVRPLRLTSMPAAKATKLFKQGDLDAVFNGDLATMPLADTGPLSRGTVRLDGVRGLFGLQVVDARGPLASAQLRGALALAIDRDGLLQPFNIGGWVAATRITPPDLPGRADPPDERWLGMDLDQRRTEARQRISAWRAADRNGGDPRIAIDLPPGPGSDIVFGKLAQDFQSVGVRLERAKRGERPDLRLIDRVARYDDPRWYLNQFNCGLRAGLCASDADALVAKAANTSDRAEQARLLDAAEKAMLDANIYIPIGAPIRWSLVRGGIDGFNENPWGFHPLYPMALRPT